MPVSEHRLPSDRIPHNSLPIVRDPQTESPLIRWLAAKANISAMGFLPLAYVISIGSRAVCLPLSLELGKHLEVTRLIVRLKDRAFVPVKPKPFESFENLRDVLLGRALTVCIFDPQHKAAAAAAGEEPVEQGSARTSNMKGACR
jgi:hypothetical protein